MDNIPSRVAIAKPYRIILSTLEKYLPIPNINPSYFQLLGIILSIAYLYSDSVIQKVVLISIILLADWYDGAVARKLKLTSVEGYLTDVTFDRISEGFIFIHEIQNPIGYVFFLFWIVNLVLSFISVKTHRHYSLPLRFLYIFVLLIFK